MAAPGATLAGQCRGIHVGGTPAFTFAGSYPVGTTLLMTGCYIGAGGPTSAVSFDSAGNGYPCSGGSASSQQPATIQGFGKTTHAIVGGSTTFSWNLASAWLWLDVYALSGADDFTIGLASGKSEGNVFGASFVTQDDLSLPAFTVDGDDRIFYSFCAYTFPTGGPVVFDIAGQEDLEFNSVEDYSALIYNEVPAAGSITPGPTIPSVPPYARAWQGIAVRVGLPPEPAAGLWPAVLVSRWGEYYRADTPEGNLWFRRAPHVAVPFDLEVEVTTAGTDSRPSLARDFGERTYILFSRGGSVYEVLSDSDGVSWEDPELVFSGGLFNDQAINPHSGARLTAALVGNTIQAAYIDPAGNVSTFPFKQVGDTALVVADDDGFGIAWAPGAEEVLTGGFHIDGEDSISDWVSLSDGRYWSRVT